MTNLETIADADGEIAALVYASGDRPDFVLCAFARHLVDTGRRPCGLVQLRDRAEDDACRKVLVLEDWQVVDAARKYLDADGDRCSLGTNWLDQMGARTATAIRRGVDAVIVNRFGPLETDGRGFRDAIRVASETKTPLVIAVPQFEFARWTRFSGGMTVRLDCTLDSVLTWWHRITSSGLDAVASGQRVCELK
jgi:hypothetical protein